MRLVCLTRPQSRFWNPAFGDQKSALWKETQRVAQSYNINNSILYQHHHLNGQVVSTEVQLLLSSTKARLALDGLWQGVKGVVLPNNILKSKIICHIGKCIQQNPTYLLCSGHSFLIILWPCQGFPQRKGFHMSIKLLLGSNTSVQILWT